MEIFGFTLSRKRKKAHDEVLDSFGIDRDEVADASLISQEYYRDAAGAVSIPFDAAQVPTEEAELIRNYRELAASSEVDEALQEIRNEIFIFNIPDKKAVEITWRSSSKVKQSIRKRIQEEFDYLYDLIDFDTQGIRLFDDWYVDSRLVLHKIIDKKNPKRGISRIQFIDPLKIRKVRILPRPNRDGTYNLADVREVYVHSNFDQSRHPYGHTISLNHGNSINGMQIHPDAITYVHSGNYDRSLGRYVGYLKKAILPFNSLKMMEDAMVIFRVVRAPSRLAFYVDTSGMQRNKSEEYMKQMMGRFKNKMVYDTKKGVLSDRRNIMSMVENYWLPRRNGNNVTSIETIEGQNSQEILEEVEYWRDKLWRSLGVPRSRFGEQQTGFVFGRHIEVQRDEYRFMRYLHLLRQRFIVFFEDLLRTQLILKRVITESEWAEVLSGIQWQYAEDNAFVEYKESERLMSQLQTFEAAEKIIGKYRSNDWAMRTIFRMTDDEIKREEEQINREKEDGRFTEENPFSDDDDVGNTADHDDSDAPVNGRKVGDEPDDDDSDDDADEKKTTDDSSDSDDDSDFSFLED